MPDPNFVAYLQFAVPTCMVGNQLDTGCPDLALYGSMSLNEMGISDLTGIEYFSNLQVLQCYGNLLTSLPTLPANLLHLNIDNNLFTTLPSIPPTLNYLECSGNDLTSLPDLPSGLISLYCENNQLTALPTLPASLEYLKCGGNNLTTLPALPDALLAIWCENNQLTSLPVLPPMLNGILCSNNNLTSLPALPSNFTQLICSGNNLTSLPDLPAGFMHLEIDDNVNLACLPFLPDAVEMIGDVYGEINLTGTAITCLPNIPPGCTNVNSIPVCASGDFVNNPNDCPEYAGIYGMVYQDTTVNCTYDAGEPGIYGASVYLLNVAGDTIGTAYTDGYGHYQFNVLAGDYSVLFDSLNTPYDVLCGSPGVSYSVTVSTSPIQMVDFAAQCVSSSFDIGTSYIAPAGWVFPGQQHTLYISGGNIGNLSGMLCNAGITGDVVVKVTGPVTYVGPAPGAVIPSSVTGNIITYSGVYFDDMFMFNSIFETDTTAQSFDVACVNVLVTPTLDDVKPANNNVNFCYNVLNSYDPNTKSVYPQYVEPGYEDWLTYTIHFQNTGAAPAFNIKLKDTLDLLIEPGSFDLIGSSHAVGVQVLSDVITFTFDDIMLPDSTSDPLGSIGTVQYRVKPQSALPDATEINNECYIYFDFNAPILTNTATTYFMQDLGMNEQIQLENGVIYPNPFSNSFSFQLPENLINESHQVVITDLTGKVLFNQFYTNQNLLSINLADEPAGIYIMTVIHGSETDTYKLVKQ